MKISGREKRRGARGRWIRRLVVAGLAYVTSLGVIFAIGPAPNWSVWDIVVVYPAIGMLVGVVLVGAIYEVFAVDLPVVLDTLRFASRKLLPRRWARPASVALTRWWSRTPAWMRRGPWMADDDARTQNEDRRDDNA